MTQIVRSKLVRDGYAKVHLLTLRESDGEEHQREVVAYGQAACVLPYDPRRKVALVVRLPRAPLLWSGETEPIIEAPAGMIDAGEDAETAARREAMEEVGVELRELESVAQCWVSPGIVAERTHLFLAAYGEIDIKSAGGGLAEEHEGIEVSEMPLRTLLELCQNGVLHDLKTLTLVLALRLRHPALF
ncbi:MAG TPA: NUDIX hydrolase [Caulobacteraceae bacterium]|jgi:nudix-type nucleoside diphosphatase (YffH/AdpP family)